jgi:hypothetical protein
VVLRAGERMERENGREGGIGWEWKSEGAVGVGLGGGGDTFN